MNSFRVIAHRGYSKVAPENTLSAYKKAYEEGYQYVECDIQFTADSIPVLLHDSTINRTSSGKGFVFHYTLEQLNELDFGSWRFKEYSDEPILTFDDFMYFCKSHNIHPYVELKDTKLSQDEIDVLLMIVNEHEMMHKMSWISSNYYNLQSISNSHKTARLGLIGKFNNHLIEKGYQLKNNFNEVFLDVSRKSIQNNDLLMAWLMEFDIEVWTVDNPFKAHELIRRGISGITTNRLSTEDIICGNKRVYTFKLS